MSYTRSGGNGHSEVILTVFADYHSVLSSMGSWDEPERVGEQDVSIGCSPPLLDKPSTDVEADLIDEDVHQLRKANGSKEQHLEHDFANRH
jgi:hypothetical protein